MIEKKRIKILITGSRGFIGDYLHELLQNDYNIFEYDLDFKNRDIRDKFKLDRLFDKERFDVVIHLAARAGVRTGEEFPDEFISTNINGTKNIIEACEKYKVKQLISFSSSSVLGGNIDIKGKKIEPLKEDDNYNPKSLYAISKVVGEMMLKNSNLNYTIIRPFTVYGENGRKDMVIYKWIEQIKRGEKLTVFGDGKSKRGYTNVNDLVDGVKRCILNEKAYHQTIHLGGSEVISLVDLMLMFNEYLEKDMCLNRLPMPKADVMESWTNSDKAKKLLGWEPKANFKEYLTNILTKEL